ncbi:hypothetical protein HYY75_11975 [bacterium]|nr:hypothetical protein [bacterium]
MNSEASGEKKKNPDLLIPPFGWVFKNQATAFLFSILFMPALWFILAAMRKVIWPKEEIFWSSEILTLLGFTYAGFLSLLLSKMFNALRNDFTSQGHPELISLFSKQYCAFHSTRWMVTIPIILSTIAISIRFICVDYLKPFGNFNFEVFWTAWLFLGFCFVLNAMALCARYTEIVRELGNATASGVLKRSEIKVVSKFYFKVAILASIHFALSAFIVYSIYLIYTYRGAEWPGYTILNWLSSLPSSKLKELIHSPESLSTFYFLFLEIACVFLLYATVSLGAVAYFILPQWGVHKLLSKRKTALIEKLESLKECAESSMVENPTEPLLEKFTKYDLIKKSLNDLSEWPFEAQGILGTLLLVGIPSLLVLFKEFLLEAFVSFATK